MAALGKFNILMVVKEVDFGVYLNGGDLGEILLPRRYAPADCEIGDSLKVFVYLDSNDLPIATNEIPLVTVGECASLTVLAVNEVGAFLDWGLPKDLLVPFSEQGAPMQVGRSYVVHVYTDNASDRIVATTRLNKYLPEFSDDFQIGQAVDLLIFSRTDLGYKAVVDNVVVGLIFQSEAIKPLKIGMRTKGYIKQVREDGKLDLSLQLTTKQGLTSLADIILAHLIAEGGSSSITDRSSPDVIAAQFGVSKKSYKKALGGLYKQRKIIITPEKISVVAANGD